VALIRILPFAVIVVGIMTVLAILAGLAHGVKFDNWLAVAGFFYAAEVCGGLVFLIASPSLGMKIGNRKICRR
jgi:hypothetical protein